MSLPTKIFSQLLLLLLFGSGALGTATTASAEVNLNLLTEINTDREAVVRRYAERWYEAAGELQSTMLYAFNEADNNQLLAIDNAVTYEEVRAILLGLDTQTAAKGVAQKLGDSAADLLYTPVVPCRIIATKNITDGTLAAGDSRAFKVYGDAAMISAQGGKAEGCPSPRGEPSAVHINVTAVPFGPEPQGNIRAFPTGEEEPQASLVNFKLGTNIANAATIKTCRFCVNINSDHGDDITLKANFAGTDVVVDVLGYYYPADSKDTARLPIAIASYDAAGVKLSGTENMTNANTINEGIYTITITGEPYNKSTHTVLATITTNNTTIGRCINNNPTVFDMDNGTFSVYTYDSAEGVEPCGFNLVIYKNNPSTTIPPDGI